MNTLYSIQKQPLCDGSTVCSKSVQDELLKVGAKTSMIKNGYRKIKMTEYPSNCNVEKVFQKGTGQVHLKGSRMQ